MHGKERIKRRKRYAWTRERKKKNSKHVMHEKEKWNEKRNIFVPLRYVFCKTLRYMTCTTYYLPSTSFGNQGPSIVFCEEVTGVSLKKKKKDLPRTCMGWICACSIWFILNVMDWTFSDNEQNCSTVDSCQGLFTEYTERRRKKIQ